MINRVGLMLLLAACAHGMRSMSTSAHVAEGGPLGRECLSTHEPMWLTRLFSTGRVTDMSNEAVTAAIVSSVVYDKEPPSQIRTPCGQMNLVQTLGTWTAANRAAHYQNDEFFIIGFKGTDISNRGDVLNDAGILLNPFAEIGDWLGIADDIERFGSGRKSIVTGHSLGGTIAAKQAADIQNVIIHIFNAGTSLSERSGQSSAGGYALPGRHFHHIARDPLSAGIIPCYQDHTYKKIYENAHSIYNFVPVQWRQDSGWKR